MDKEKPIVLGVDIGGSHITAAIVDLATRSVASESIKRKSIDSKGSKAQLIQAWIEVIKSVYQQHETSEIRIGISMPGPFDYENGISLIIDQDKFKALYQVNVKQELALGLGIPVSNICFMNDAAAFMQGEVFAGAAKGYQRAIGLTLGTGLGSAFADNGIAEDMALWNSPFLSGVSEDYFSTRWFVGKYAQLTDRALGGVKELAEIANTDPYAKQIFNEFGRGLGHFLADIIKEKAAEVVVLGGNIAQAFPLFAPHLIENLKAYHLDTEIKPALLNEQASLIGAACEWKSIVLQY